MSEGEIIQMKKSKSLDLDEELYFKIIEKNIDNGLVYKKLMSLISK